MRSATSGYLQRHDPDRQAAAELLRRGRALLVEQGWCQGAPAVDERGNPVDPRSGRACRYCASGALTFAASGTFARPSLSAPRAAVDLAREALIAACAARLPVTPRFRVSAVPAFNDGEETDLASVLSAYDAAIEGLEQA